MGILNVTPDSFSDGGQFVNPNKAIDQALLMAEQGAVIIDVGGESTRPGSQPVDEKTELKRVIPVIDGIRKESSVFISIDTYKSRVAEAALETGADIINDISGGTFDKNILPLAAKWDCPLILMHILGTPQDMQSNPKYQSVVNEIYEYFEDRLQKTAEYDLTKVAIDPGIGFGKRIQDNLLLLRDLKDFLWLGKPVLVGTSRKSFIGKVLSRDISDRLTGTVVTNLIAMQNGARILRVHDVEEVVDMVKLTDEIYHI